MTDVESIFTGTSRQIRFGGVGGQGVVLVGRLLGKAAALFDGKEAVCTQTYGPEARGGASRADVVISDDPVDYPFVTEADVLVVLFQEAYARFHSRRRPGGMLIVDNGLVQPRDDEENMYGFPATKIAEDLGSRLAANIVMLGYLVAVSDVVSDGSMREAITANVPKGTEEMNIKAYERGLELGSEQRKG